MVSWTWTLSKKAARPQTPRHILVWDEDWEYLDSRFGQAGLHPIGVSRVLRALIHQRVLEWREAENAALTAAARQKMEQQDGNPPNIERTDGGSSRVDI